MLVKRLELWLDIVQLLHGHQVEMEQGGMDAANSIGYNYSCIKVRARGNHECSLGDAARLLYSAALRTLHSCTNQATYTHFKRQIHAWS